MELLIFNFIYIPVTLQIKVMNRQSIEHAVLFQGQWLVILNIYHLVVFWWNFFVVNSYVSSSHSKKILTDQVFRYKIIIALAEIYAVPLIPVNLTAVIGVSCNNA